MIKELSPTEFKNLANESYELIDVRSSGEYQLVNIGGKLIPLDELNSRHSEMNDDNKKIILLCHHGRRSMIACQMLENLGYDNIFNLTGGIDRVATETDNKLTRY
ncbi:MAG: hypothetical protein HON23_06300 [Rickettsiales bacterium]|jgi:rhodanese-related sulfurtransferase|nr:hypothetical protein [Rickettsiales bacterium]